MKSLKVLKKEYSRLKRNKINTKKLMLELMRISSNDFTVERMSHKLYLCGFNQCDADVYKYLNQLCYSFDCIFVGYMPEKVNDRVVGFIPVFGLVETYKEMNG